MKRSKKLVKDVDEALKSAHVALSALAIVAQREVVNGGRKSVRRLERDAAALVRTLEELKLDTRMNSLLMSIQTMAKGDVVSVVPSPDEHDDSVVEVTSTGQTHVHTVSRAQPSTAEKEAASTDRVPAAKVPAKKTPAKKAPTTGVSTKKVPAKKVPTTGVSTRKTPAKKAPVKRAPAAEAPAKKVTDASASERQ